MRSLRTTFLEWEPVRLLRVAPLKTLLFRLLTRGAQARSYLCPEVYFHAGRGVRLLGPGRLYWGTRWKYCRYYPSQLRLLNGATVEVEGDFNFKTGFEVLVGDGAVLRLGSGYMNSRGMLECMQEIRLGHDVLIGPNVVIRDCDHHSIDPSKPLSAPIIIGDKVWIGDGAKIMKGVTIGRGAVIAAGAVVTRDVPARALAAGVPARVIRENISWE